MRNGRLLVAAALAVLGVAAAVWWMSRPRLTQEISRERASPANRGAQSGQDELEPSLREAIQRCAEADAFDFPVAPPDAAGYYNAQPFGENDHLGDDWNGVGGGDSDYGDPVYAVANGVVVFAEDVGDGWGSVMRIVHRMPGGGEDFVESLYAHVSAMDVHVGDTVQRGQRIGAIGNANGQYPAHLHLEIRTEAGLPLGTGYSADKSGYTDPTEFLQTH